VNCVGLSQSRHPQQLSNHALVMFVASLSTRPTAVSRFLQSFLLFILCVSMAGGRPLPRFTEVTSCTVLPVPTSYVTTLPVSSTTVLFNASCDALASVTAKHGHERCALRVQWPNSRFDETCKSLTSAYPVCKPTSALLPSAALLSVMDGCLR
jgi:hypothetical protein